MGPKPAGSHSAGMFRQRLDKLANLKHPPAQLACLRRPGASGRQDAAPDRLGARHTAPELKSDDLHVYLTEAGVMAL